ncbi:MAG TPA: methyltransferase domain-containing protein [Chryseolinea sp.]|nr:methyltransferase domain-containing protein [Chryseolinea sp.]
MKSSGWAKFWEGQGDAFSTIMKINTAFFGDRLKKEFALKPRMRILDYGCGPGLLADQLAPDDLSITGVDINNDFILQCQKNHPRSQFIQISPDINITERLLADALAGTQFDVIVLLSILQYFKEINEVESVLRLLHGYTLPTGKIILADVIAEGTKPLNDTISLFVQSVRQNKVGAFFGFIFYLISSDYRKVSAESKLLSISLEAINDIATRQGFSLAKMEGLTIHRSRTNYVLTKLQ